MYRIKFPYSNCAERAGKDQHATGKRIFEGLERGGLEQSSVETLVNRTATPQPHHPKPAHPQHNSKVIKRRCQDPFTVGGCIEVARTQRRHEWVHHTPVRVAPCWVAYEPNGYDGAANNIVFCRWVPM